MSEKDTIEYKSILKIRGKDATSAYKDIARTCVCFANAQGGDIYIGFENDSKTPPHGQIISQDEINETLKRIRDLTDAVSVHSSDILTYDNGSQYFILHVVPNAKAIAATSKGEFYIRVGDECVPIRGEDIQRLAADKETFKWETHIHSRLRIEDMNDLEIKEFLYGIRNSDKVKPFISNKSDLEILEHYNLTLDGAMTNLGILWLGYPHQRARLSYPITVQYLVYNQMEGKIRKEVWTDYELNPKKQLLEIEEKAVEFKYFHELPEGMFRSRVRHYSDRVIRELLVNAFAHKSFTISANIEIAVYPNKLLIKNPGGLPLGVTKNNILHKNIRRNPNLIRIFHDIGLMEGEGSGYDMIYEELSRDSKAFPEISSDFDSFTVVQNSEILDEEILILMSHVGIHFQLTQKDFITLGVIARHKKILATQLSKELQLSEDRLRDWVTRLLDLKIIINRGQKKGTEYLINPQLIFSAKLNTKPSLKTIEPHALRALIMEDLKYHPNSSISQIHERIGQDTIKADVQKAVYYLFKKGDVDKSGPTKKTVYFLAKKK